MTDQTNNSNNHPNPNKEEEYPHYSMETLRKYLYEHEEPLRKKIVSCQDYLSAIDNLSLINDICRDRVIPLINSVHKEIDPPVRMILASMMDVVYDVFNDVYQLAFKKVESLGINPSRLPQASFPKSLEKLAFPENN